MPKRIARIAGQLGEDMANAVQFVFELREKILRLIEWAKNNRAPAVCHGHCADRKKGAPVRPMAIETRVI